MHFGDDVTREDLLATYDAVVYATGAMRDRRMGIPGEDLPGSYAATDFVNWYCGHPDVDPAAFTLDAESVAVIGVGNVAVDVARILVRDPAELRGTDISEPVLEALRAEQGPRGAHDRPPRPGAGQVHHQGAARAGRAGRRGRCRRTRRSSTWPTASTRSGESRRARRDRPPRPRQPGRDARAGTRRPGSAADRAAAAPVLAAPGGNPRIIDPERSRGSSPRTHPALTSGVLRGTGEFETLDAQMVLRSVGYQSVPLPGVPFDARSHTVPNADGRVLGPDGEPLPGEYVAGWLKRGPTGVIGTNKSDAAETVRALLADLAGGPGEGDAPLPRPGLLRLPRRHAGGQPAVRRGRGLAAGRGARGPRRAARLLRRLAAHRAAEAELAAVPRPRRPGEAARPRRDLVRVPPGKARLPLTPFSLSVGMSLPLGIMVFRRFRLCPGRASRMRRRGLDMGDWGGAAHAAGTDGRDPRTRHGPAGGRHSRTAPRRARPRRARRDRPPDPAEFAADDAIFTAVLDAANECLGRFDTRPAGDRWCDALLQLLQLAQSAREAG